MEKLRAMDWQVQFALNLTKFKRRFVESETDVLILRGQDDMATFECVQSMSGCDMQCGLVWLYQDKGYSESPYFQIADNSASLDTPDVELIAIVQSVFNRLKRSGWR